ncbi:LAQU0S04e05908g1_1 [Lachancea quebecensis]|uniref:Autophagy-related protein 14 n=1 Tax=Lachancea quebecensis TaxID=1654605 RepID=A0A0P1KSM6_9SACH|nr:LAQU0S04e05908g1_1 [Lachancea quebecensis]
MAIKCCTCHRQGKAMYCPHCVNTSPSLLLRYKMELYQVAAAREELRLQVDGILRDAMNGDAQPSGVLGKHLAMLRKTHLKRKTNKIRSKLQQLQEIVQAKRERVRKLKTQLNQPSVRVVSSSENKDKTVQFRNSHQKLTMLRRVLESSKALKFQALVHLFLIRQREHPEFPFTISFQPIVNVHNLCHLPQNVIECSLRSMWDFLLLAGRVLLIELPLQKPAKDVIDSLTGIVLNLLVFLQSLELVPQKLCGDRGYLRSLLRNYDVDRLFYYMVMNRDIELLDTSELHSAVNYEACHAELQAMLQGSSELSVLNKSIDDKWFLVG